MSPHWICFGGFVVCFGGGFVARALAAAAQKASASTSAPTTYEPRLI
jgi:hypothetical protein